MRRWAIINVLLGVIVVLLAIQIVSTWARALPKLEERSRQPPPAPEPREKGRRASDKGGPRTPATPDVLVSSIGDKDLFDPTRRAAPEDGGPQTTQQEAAPLPPPSGIAVVGIRLLHGEREAFIQDATQQNKQRRLRVGDQLQSFTVKEITDGQVILGTPAGQSVTMDVELKKSGGARGPAPAAPQRSPAAGVTATTISIPRLTTTSTTRPPGPRGTVRAPGAAAADMPSLNRAVEQKLQQIRKRGSDAGRPGARVEPLAAAPGSAQVTRRTS
jgi:hypothetical protein